MSMVRDLRLDFGRRDAARIRYFDTTSTV